METIQKTPLFLNTQDIRIQQIWVIFQESQT